MAAPKENKYAVGNNGGRPALYETPEQLIEACDEYFTYIEGEYKTENVTQKNPETGKKETKEIKIWTRYPEPATVTGLALFLGFESKQSLYDYEKKEEFSYPIKRARLRIEHGYELKLHGDKNTGAIFALKNMDWDDKVKQELSGGFVWKEERSYAPNV